MIIKKSNKYKILTNYNLNGFRWLKGLIKNVLKNNNL